MPFRKKDPDALTPKQALFVKHYTNPKCKATFLNKTGAMKAVGVHTEGYAGVGGYTMSKKPQVKAAILEQLHLIKVTPQYQARKLKELMEANRGVYNNGLKVGTEPDNEVRHKALVTSLKITDALDSIESQVNNLNINISPELADRLLTIAREMRQMRESHSGQVIPLISNNKLSNSE
jgi:phage terminase small subunit